MLYSRCNKNIFFFVVSKVKTKQAMLYVTKEPLGILKPYKPTSPFQIFLFLSRFLTKVFKKQTLFFSVKLKTNPFIFFDTFLLKETAIAENTLLLKVWSFVLTNFERKSVKAMPYFFHYFFLEFSKKKLPEISKFFSSIKELMFHKRLKGFFWGQKGKVAWKALSRKQSVLSLFGSYSKVNYNLAASCSDYSYSSVTGTVFFKSNIFY